MTDPPIPDAPGLPPWLLAYAEHDGQYVWLKDQREEGDDSFPSFQVGAGRPACSCVPGTSEEDCPVLKTMGSARYHHPQGKDHLRGWPHCIPEVYRGNDEAEALAVFAHHRDRLAEESE